MLFGHALHTFLNKGQNCALRIDHGQMLKSHNNCTVFHPLFGICF